MVATVTVGNSPVGVAITRAQIVVTTVADSGPGSLRAAITTANSDGGPTNIVFDPAVFPPPPAAPGVILLNSALPTLTGMGDTIDGTGAGVILDGSASPSGSVALQVRQSNITVRGLTIQHFSNRAIVLSATAAATVTGVVIDHNTLLSNLSGIFITGTGPNSIVQAAVTNNTVTDSIRNGILVWGNSGNTTGDTVTVLIDGNSVSRSHAQGGFGDGIVIETAIGSASNNHVIATVSNNTVTENEAEGIIVDACGSAAGASGTNNSVDVVISNNTAKNNATTGILVSAAGSGTTCSGNHVSVEISTNTVSGNATNISVNGGSGYWSRRSGSYHPKYCQR